MFGVESCGRLVEVCGLEGLEAVPAFVLGESWGVPYCDVADGLSVVFERDGVCQVLFAGGGFTDVGLDACDVVHGFGVRHEQFPVCLGGCV